MIIDGVVDIHSHILPALDDGPGTVDESVEMARIAFGEGIRTIVCTPHVEKGYEELIARASEARVQLKEVLSRQKLPIKLALGFEALVCERLLDYEDIKKLAFYINGKAHMLLELDFDCVPACLDEALYLLGLNHITPILAHPERYHYLHHDIAFLKKLKEKSVKLQTNAGSVTGFYGREVKKFAKKIIQNGLVDFIATDMHSAGRRGPYIRQAWLQVDGWMSGRAAGLVLNQNID